MDCFRDPSFAAAALSLAWLCGALPPGAFRFDVTRGGVNNALATVAKCGGLSVAAVVLLLSIRAAAAGVPAWRRGGRGCARRRVARRVSEFLLILQRITFTLVSFCRSTKESSTQAL